MQRIGAFLTAEELEEPYAIDNDAANKWAIRMKGTFEWDKVEKVEAGKFGGMGEGKGKDVGKQPGKGSKEKDGEGKDKAETKPKGAIWPKWKKGSKEQPTLPAPATASDPTSGASGRSSTTAAIDSEAKKEKKENDDEKPFALEDISLQVPKGSFVAIVGRVGSGKSSLLQSLVGEIRKKEGKVVFGGSVAYAPQTPWIMNASLRENVLFGQPDDEEK